LPILLDQFEFAYFPLACSSAEISGEYDVALVEGCVSITHERELLQELRKRSRYLIAVGTCAMWGGIAALRNGDDRDMLWRQVYGASNCVAATTEPVPLHSVVAIDAAISGCPPEKDELLRVLAWLVRGALPVAIDYPVCSECRMRENSCLLMDRNRLCLGLLTVGGCAARCPSRSVPCEGCRGPLPEANVQEALAIFAEKGFGRESVIGRLRRFCTEWPL
jgi:coenzyme F420-reducing hydrogenase gamma subunit